MKTPCNTLNGYAHGSKYSGPSQIRTPLGLKAVQICETYQI